MWEGRLKRQRNSLQGGAVLQRATRWGVVFFVLACGTGLGAVSATANAATVAGSGVAQLRAFVAQVKSARGDFTQRQQKTAAPASAAAGQRVTPGGTSTGVFAFARPGKFIWSYQKPYEQDIRSDGVKLYVYDKDLSQVTVRALGNALSASPAAILFGSNDLDSNFTVTDAGEHDGMKWAQLVPKSKDSQFQTVTIGFRDGELAAMTLHDVFGNITDLSFANLQKNPSLDAGEFKFSPPKGVDVLQG